VSPVVVPTPTGVDRGLVIVLILAIGSGCARNADLELTLTLPQQPAGTPAMFAYVQFERPPVAFDSEWAGTTDVDGTRLGTAAAPAVVQLSVLTEDVAAPLRMKVRFCSSPRCESAGPTTPTLWYELEQPFHRGARTYWSRVIDAIPAPGHPCAPETIDRCAIRGCVTVFPPTDPVSFCRLDGTHFCDPPVGGMGPDAGRSVDGAMCGASDGGGRDGGPHDAAGGDR